MALQTESDHKSNKNLIEKTTFKNGNNIITSYSAEWCPSCRRIKPEFLKYLKELSFEKVSFEVIAKEIYKEKYQYIPGFIINDKYIQTSNITELRNFTNEILKYSRLDSF